MVTGTVMVSHISEKYGHMNFIEGDCHGQSSSHFFSKFEEVEILFYEF